MSDPIPPEDEPWRVWHRAGSEQLATVASGLTSDPLPVLYRADDFANRALAKANPCEKLVTHAMQEAIAQVRQHITGKRDFVLTESVMTHILADIEQIVDEWQFNPGQRSDEEWFIMLRAALAGEDYGAPPFEGYEKDSGDADLR